MTEQEPQSSEENLWKSPGDVGCGLLLVGLGVAIAGIGVGTGYCIANNPYNDNEPTPTPSSKDINSFENSFTTNEIVPINQP